MFKDKINVLTYDVSFHRKTYDTLNLLKTCGYDNVTVYALPLHYEKKQNPLYLHRPGDYGICQDRPRLEDQCRAFAFNLKKIESLSNEEFMIFKGDVFLVCGAGILPEDFIRNNYVINSHPGYIPLVRGLDALKWAVYNGDPIGVTTHLLGEEIDAGEVIERCVVPMYWNDTFHAVAQRQYELEIQMLVSAIEHLFDDHEIFHGENHPVHRRMPHSYEMRLMERFESYIKDIPIAYDNKVSN